MDREAFAEILGNISLQTVFQAALLVSYEHDGHTMQTLADMLGVNRSTIQRWINKARQTRRGELHPELLQAHPLSPRICPHRPGEIKPGRPALCLECLLSNFEQHKSLRKDYRNDPALQGPKESQAKFKPRSRKKKAK